MPTECICMSMILLVRATSTINPLAQANQAADHLIKGNLRTFRPLETLARRIQCLPLVGH